jgi:hypothetical protein
VAIYTSAKALSRWPINDESTLTITEKISENLRGKKDPENLDILSASSIYKILSKNSYGDYKYTVKPSLTKTMKKARKD